MGDEIDKTKNLSPEERIKKLKEIQEKSKKELNETENLINQSIEEIQISQETKNIPIPENREVNIEKLFVPESIDDVIQKEKPEVSEEQLKQQADYSMLTRELRRQSTENVVNRVEDLYNQVRQTGSVTREQLNEAYAAQAVARERQDEIGRGTYVGTIGEKIADQLNMAMGIANWIKNMYRTR
ncbi:MAG: hypothetical protein PHV16_02060 [Candidatus Nanoarchaeia archaeon]|nr:hypothetical protein [Candidatus Nanoarchaeia archaeon]